MKYLTKLVLVVAMLSTVCGVAFQTPTYAACNSRFLTFPAWYNNLTTGADCSIASPNDNGGIQKFITIIVLNIVEMVMQLVGYATVIFLMVGGFRYLTAAGAPEQMTAAKKTVTNAAIGLIIAIIAVAIVNLVGSVLV